ncbi:hypothetical protein L3Q82_010531, partial [Scortum barcoo]
YTMDFLTTNHKIMSNAVDVVEDKDGWSDELPHGGEMGASHSETLQALRQPLPGLLLPGLRHYSAQRVPQPQFKTHYQGNSTGNALCCVLPEREREIHAFFDDLDQDLEAELYGQMEVLLPEMQAVHEQLQAQWEIFRAEQARLEEDQNTLRQQRASLHLAQQNLEEERQQLRLDMAQVENLIELQFTVDAMTETMLQIKRQAKAAVQNELKEVQKVVVQLKEELQGQNYIIETLRERIKELEKQEKKQDNSATNIAPLEAEEEQEKGAASIAPAKIEEQEEGATNITPVVIDEEEQEKGAASIAPVEAQEEQEEGATGITPVVIEEEEKATDSIAPMEAEQNKHEKPQQQVIYSMEEATSGEVQKTSKKPTAWRKIMKALTGGSKKSNEKKEKKKRRAIKKLSMDEDPHVVEVGVEEETPHHNELCSSQPHKNSQRPSVMTVAMRAHARWEVMDRDDIFYAGVALMVLGTVLVVSSFLALGFTGTFLGDYFGILMDEKVTVFPFNIIENPMYWGSTANYLGLAFV